MGKKRVLVGYGIDIDAVAGWLGSYGGEDSVSDISRGLWAGHVGTPRLLKMFEKHNIKATWFIPGHSLETFPEECAAVRDAGHEIGLHGYSHENPASMTREQQRDILDKTYRMFTDFCGKPPRGIVAPWWEASAEMVELLLAYGIEYDHSMSHEDCQMYWLRTGDSWTKIDYSQKAETWMKPLVRGQTTGLVEIPGSWYIDDLPPMMFIKNSANSHGWVNPRDVEDIWKGCAQDHFDYFYREYDEFVFPMTIHPDVSGRPHVLLMHERIIEHINKHEGVEWVTFEQMCDEFKQKNQPPEGALMPAAPGALTKTLRHQGMSDASTDTGYGQEAVGDTSNVRSEDDLSPLLDGCILRDRFLLVVNDPGLAPSPRTTGTSDEAPLPLCRPPVTRRVFQSPLALDVVPEFPETLWPCGSDVDRVYTTGGTLPSRLDILLRCHGGLRSERTGRIQCVCPLSSQANTDT
ncbi:uncharacterized protein N7459_005034 [Penicillium hispanicum]|uniref:uncharacterized protein n=1 Tax=Penicillium hispanicum TaxID=1080232 RepID=UPI0025403BDF|nr:uncharacterized protein N7459_005034 [Penicillium hispanicum]KAJ5585234.1 hypothetical protein N7459_005034 [Penicillium hispanicum]